MLQHLDDPVPLPSASAHQRRAVMERGAALRRRRWALIAGIPTVAAVVTALAVGLPALPEGPAYDRTAAPAAPPARPSASAEPADPVTGSVVFGGAEEVSATVSLPPGWVTEEVFVLRSGADPKPGVAFFDVANIYADGCRWVPLQPPVGPTVDDLVQAFASMPGFGGEVRDVTVDGYQGKQIGTRSRTTTRRPAEVAGSGCSWRTADSAGAMLRTCGRRRPGSATSSASSTWTAPGS
jgi:hypothetical protein